MADRYCKRCGEALEADVRFCVNCGQDSNRANQPQTTSATMDERLHRLSEFIGRRTFEGWIVVDKNEQNATAVLMLPGKPVNHVLHAILTIFTCLLWGIVWIVMAAAQKKERRMRITVDPHGILREETLTV